MINAKDFAEKFDVNIEQYYTCFDEDLSICPNNFKKAGVLEHSVLDYSTFNKKRKLPLIKDILDKLYESSDADYFIYTNVDIALMPHFYLNVFKMINDGIDAIVINRRTISDRYTSIDEIPQMYSEIGEEHPGLDCFIFKRESYKFFNLDSACIGANSIGKILISNLILNSVNFRLFKNEHLTFHIGDDRSWKVNAFEDYHLHNENILINLLKENENTLEKHSLLNSYKTRYLKK
ncbi:MAG: hypothetical protein WCY75_05260 [Sulfurimonadaceae bacterium]